MGNSPTFAKLASFNGKISFVDLSNNCISLNPADFNRKHSVAKEYP
jgi:hypothetical protein